MMAKIPGRRNYKEIGRGVVIPNILARYKELHIVGQL
jgi:hypothetical protein